MQTTLQKLHCPVYESKVGTTNEEGNEMDLVDKIMAFEEGLLGDADMLRLFSELTKSGQVWQLQGSYGRGARWLIEEGMMDSKGNLLIDPDAAEGEY